MEQISWIAEYVAFAVMLGLSVIIGLYYGCIEGKQNTINDYLLGGKHMSVFPITMSLIARYLRRMRIEMKLHIFKDDVRKTIPKGFYEGSFNENST